MSYCKYAKSEAQIINDAGTQTHDAVAGVLNLAVKTIVAQLRDHPGVNCIKALAPSYALLEHLTRLLLAHRQMHGDMLDLASHKELVKHPGKLLVLAEDLAEMQAEVLRRLDPTHDYLIHVFQTDRKKPKEE